MPLYAYRCTQCNHQFEKIQSFSSEQEMVCPKCQGLLERPLTAPRLHFKGAGWYVNDYAARPSQPSESHSESTPVETKAPAAKSESAPSAPAATPASAPAPASSSTTPSS